MEKLKKDLSDLVMEHPLGGQIVQWEGTTIAGSLPTIGNGSIVVTGGKVTTASGVGFAGQARPVIGTGNVARTTGCGNINEK
jgi:hypothetical protein